MNFFSTSLAEADTEEDVTLLIFNRNTTARLSKSDVLKVLKKVNLTGRGYKKEVSYQTVMSSESKSHFKASTAIIPFRSQWITSTFQTPFVVRNQNLVYFLYFSGFSYISRGAVSIPWRFTCLLSDDFFFFQRNRTSITN